MALENQPPLLPHDEEHRRERRYFSIVFVLGLVALVFGYLQLQNSIRQPFRSNVNGLINGLGETGTIIATLSRQDTDGDGINDFDELYVYQTSPYLTDSDSDGVVDQDEISTGADPNCPTGETCSPLELTGSTNGTTSNTNGGVSTPSSLSLDALRVALRNAGAPAATLDSLDDQTLLDLYEQVTGQPFDVNAATNSSTNGATNTPTNGTSNVALPATIDAETLQNLTPSQIRALLIQGGADAEALSEIDDETLALIFDESLADILEQLE